MALTVTAPDLVTAAFDDMEAPRIVAALAAEGRSFYFEPWPNGRARISVNREHAAALQKHVNAARPAPWHLFIVSDGSSHPVLISVESESTDDAEALAIADALESWDLDEAFLGTEYVGAIDCRVNKRF